MTRLGEQLPETRSGHGREQGGAREENVNSSTRKKMGKRRVGKRKARTQKKRREAWIKTPEPEKRAKVKKTPRGAHCKPQEETTTP